MLVAFLLVYADAKDLNSLYQLKNTLESLEVKLSTINERKKRANVKPRRLADPQLNDRVKLRHDIAPPRLQHTRKVGRLVAFHADKCIVDFPNCPGWRGQLSDLELVAAASTLPRVGDSVRARAFPDRLIPPKWPSRDTIGICVSIEAVGASDRCVVEFGRNYSVTEKSVSSMNDATKWVGPIEALHAVDDYGEPLEADSLSSTDAFDALRVDATHATPAFRLGWVLGLSAARFSAMRPSLSRTFRTQSGTSIFNNGNSSSEDISPRATQILQQLRDRLFAFVGSLILPLTFYVGIVGLYVSMMAITADISVASIVDGALGVAAAMLTKRSIIAVATEEVSERPLGQTLLVWILRSPSSYIAAAILYKLLILPTLPCLLQKLEEGYLAGFRAHTSSRGHSRRVTEEFMAEFMGISSRSVTLVQAARISALSLGSLAAIEWVARRTSLVQPLATNREKS